MRTSAEVDIEGHGEIVIQSLPGDGIYLELKPLASLEPLDPELCADVVWELSGDEVSELQRAIALIANG